MIPLLSIAQSIQGITQTTYRLRNILAVVSELVDRQECSIEYSKLQGTLILLI